MFKETLNLVNDLEYFLIDYKNLIKVIDDIRVSSELLNKYVHSFRIKDITTDVNTKKAVKAMISTIKEISLHVKSYENLCYIFDEDEKEFPGFSENTKSINVMDKVIKKKVLKGVKV